MFQGKEEGAQGLHICCSPDRPRISQDFRGTPPHPDLLGRCTSTSTKAKGSCLPGSPAHDPHCSLLPITEQLQVWPQAFATCPCPTSFPCPAELQRRALALAQVPQPCSKGETCRENASWRRHRYFSSHLPMAGSKSESWKSHWENLGPPPLGCGAGCVLK